MTGNAIDGITTGQIYFGAIPFVCIQIIMVGLVIGFPELVGHHQTVANPSDIEIQLPLPEAPDTPPPVEFR